MSVNCYVHCLPGSQIYRQNDRRENNSGQTNQKIMIVSFGATFTPYRTSALVMMQPTAYTTSWWSTWRRNWLNHKQWVKMNYFTITPNCRSSSKPSSSRQVGSCTRASHNSWHSSAAEIRKWISRSSTEVAMKDECEATSNRNMTNPSELGGMFCNDLVEIYYRNLGDVFGTNKAGA